jgi:hypothetical protein
MIAGHDRKIYVSIFNDDLFSLNYVTGNFTEVFCIESRFK